MFNMFDDLIESSLNICEDILECEAPSKKDLSKVGGAVLTGIAVTEGIDIIKNIFED
jgi:hypothetical protein